MVDPLFETAGCDRHVPRSYREAGAGAFPRSADGGYVDQGTNSGRGCDQVTENSAVPMRDIEVSIRSSARATASGPRSSGTTAAVLVPASACSQGAGGAGVSGGVLNSSVRAPGRDPDRLLLAALQPAAAGWTRGDVVAATDLEHRNDFFQILGRGAMATAQAR